jgi:hypothetical protein
MKQNVEARPATVPTRSKPPAVTAARVKSYDYEGLSFAETGRHPEPVAKKTAGKK